MKGWSMLGEKHAKVSTKLGEGGRDPHCTVILLQSAARPLRPVCSHWETSLFCIQSGPIILTFILVKFEMHYFDCHIIMSLTSLKMYYC